jgi:hypothetical protein
MHPVTSRNKFNIAPVAACMLLFAVIGGLQLIAGRVQTPQAIADQDAADNQ